MEYRIKSRIWIEKEDKVFLGEGRVKLLKAIDQYGSITEASKRLKISYKKAWRLINAVNTTASKPVTMNSVGGKGGGGVKLTSYGKKLTEVFDKINRNCWDFLDNQLEDLE